jgi:hypothetical protein
MVNICAASMFRVTEVIGVDRRTVLAHMVA